MLSARYLTCCVIYTDNIYGIITLELSRSPGTHISIVLFCTIVLLYTKIVKNRLADLTRLSMRLQHVLYEGV
jgi:hypothetical protein